MKKPLSPALIRLFFFLIFVAISSIAYLLIPDKAKAPTPLPNPPAANTEQTNLPTPPLLNLIIQENHTATITPEESTPELLSATLQTPDHTYTLKFNPGATLLEAMRQLIAQSAQPFIFSGKEYPSLGFFVEEINGIKNDPGGGKYWIYYIDGQTAQIGISNYIIKSNDIITWKYEKSTF